MAITSRVVRATRTWPRRQTRPAVESATVDFGVLPLAPIGPPPCLQSGAIGGPADPCSYQLHHLTPEEVTVVKGGQVTFQVHGGGHGIMIYEVDKDTTREELGQYPVCRRRSRDARRIPATHACNLSAANANAEHLIKDAKATWSSLPHRTVTNVHPHNRVWYEPGRLMSIGGQQFLNGGTVPAGATSNGQLVSYRFLKTGPLPGDVHESHARVERLDVRLRQRRGRQRLALAPSWGRRRSALGRLPLLACRVPLPEP